jgi:hypothetical protein
MNPSQKFFARVALRFFSFFTLYTMYFMVSEGMLSKNKFMTVLFSAIALVVSAELFTIFRIKFMTSKSSE